EGARRQSAMAEGVRSRHSQTNSGAQLQRGNSTCNPRPVPEPTGDSSWPELQSSYFCRKWGVTMRKCFASVVALGALMLLFASAGGVQARPAKQTVTTVTLSGWSSGTAEDALLQQVIAQFDKTHPSIHVDYSVINGDYPTAMTARFAAHNPPDVF